MKGCDGVADSGVVDGEVSRQLLVDWGFELPCGGTARTSREAVEVARRLGFPVVLKLDSTQILHKTEIGGVELDLRTSREVRDAFSRLVQRAATAVPDVSISGLRVEEMRSGGVELFLGLEDNPEFGPTITVGIGGILAELLSDVAIRLLPVSRADIVSMLGEMRSQRLLDGFRGSPPVDREALIHLISRFAALGASLSERLGSVDLNPVWVSGDRHCVLDAKVLLRAEARETPRRSPNTENLSGFFDARAVAVVGASPTPAKLGNAIVQSLVQTAYHGKVLPINPRNEKVLGLAAYPSLTAVPEKVDLVVAAIPLMRVAEVVAEMGEVGIRNLVIVSSGGKEVGDEGRELEARIAAAARGSGVRIIGPNCIGVFNARNGLDTFFQTPSRMRRPVQGSVALITQSGTVGVAFLEQAATFGISKMISYGNRLDVNDADLVCYLGSDPDTRVIACYIEGLTEGREFLEAVRAVARVKPIVVYKAGRTAAAGQASLSHTGFFGGTYGPWKGGLLQAGAATADSFEEFVAIAKTLSMQPRAQGRRVAMVSNGAGPMVQAMDLLPERSVMLAQLGTTTLERMRAHYPPFFITQNPLDLTGSATASDYAFGIDALLADESVDVVMPWFVFQDTALGEEVVAFLSELRSRYDKPMVAGAVGGPYTEHMRRELESSGIPVLGSVREWVAAAVALTIPVPEALQ
jgi:3-hydroxypropionyl-CoA synthetase (ADP-forming)